MLRFLDRLWSFPLVVVADGQSQERTAGVVAAELCAFTNSNSKHVGGGQITADVAGCVSRVENVEEQTASCRGWGLSRECMSWLQEQEQVQSDGTAAQGAQEDVARDYVGGFVYFENGSFEEVVDVNPFRVANTQGAPCLQRVVAGFLFHSLYYSWAGCMWLTRVATWWLTCGTGHTPLSKAAYAGKRRVCEFFLGKFADDNRDQLVAPPSKHGRDADLETEAASGHHLSFARLAVPSQDLLLADGNGFRPADIARCAGFERLGDWLAKLSLAVESDHAAKSPPPALTS